MSGRSRWSACACALAVGCVGLAHAGEGLGLAPHAGAGASAGNENGAIVLQMFGYKAVYRTNDARAIGFAAASSPEGVDVINGLDVAGGSDAWFLIESTTTDPGVNTLAASLPDFGNIMVEKIDFEFRDDLPGHGDDIQVKAIPSPTAVFAGLALLGIVSVRRRRSV